MYTLFTWLNAAVLITLIQILMQQLLKLDHLKMTFKLLFSEKVLCLINKGYNIIVKLRTPRDLGTGYLTLQVLHAKVFLGTITKCPDYAGVLIFK